MAEDLVEVDEFTPAVMVPEDGDDRDAASVKQGFQPLANRTRYLTNRITGFPDTSRIWSAWQAFSDLRLQNEARYCDEAGAVVPRLRTVTVEPCGLNGWDPRVNGFAGAQSQEPAKNAVGWGKVALPIPSGGHLVRVRVGYERKAAGDDADLYIRKTTVTKTVPFAEYASVKLLEKITTGTGQQVVDLGPIDDVIDTSSAVYALEITPSSSRTQPNPDIVHWIEVQFLDPGPRNY